MDTEQPQWLPRLLNALLVCMAIGAPYAVAYPRWGEQIGSIVFVLIGAALVLWSRNRDWQWFGVLAFLLGGFLLLVWAGLIPSGGRYSKTIS